MHAIVGNVEQEVGDERVAADRKRVEAVDRLGELAVHADGALVTEQANFGVELVQVNLDQAFHLVQGLDLGLPIQKPIELFNSGFTEKVPKQNCFLKKWAYPDLFFVYFRSFSNKQYNRSMRKMSKCPSSIQCWDSNQ